MLNFAMFRFFPALFRFKAADWCAYDAKQPAAIATGCFRAL